MAETKDSKVSTDRCSAKYFEINSCGIEHINLHDRGSDRPLGRSDYHILYVERGACHLLLDGKWETVGQGGIVMFRPGEPQHYRYFKGDDSVSHYIHFTGVGCQSLLRRLGIEKIRVFMMGRSKTYEDISEKLAREFSMQLPLCMAWCTAYAYELLNIVARKYALRQVSVDHKSESRIHAACRRIYESIDSPPAVAELARECCLSESRFLHLFREVSGKSVTAFIASIRIERAKELLASTDLSVREIAEAVGYEDQNYFSRCFRKAEGCSPRDFRRNSSM